MLIPLGILASSGAGGASFELISTTILGTSQSSVTFSSIPSGYTHLQIRMTSRTDESGATYNDSGFIELNGDTTNGNYNAHYLSANGSGVNASYTGGKIGSIRTLATSLNSASNYASHVIDLTDYTNVNKYKTVRVFSGQINSQFGSFGIAQTSLLWMNTSAVNSIKLAPNSGSNWVAGSRFSLYGIKG